MYLGRAALSSVYGAAGALIVLMFKHLGETEGQIDRLEQVFAEIDKKPQGKTCDAIGGNRKGRPGN